MRKFTLILSLLVAMVTTAMAQLSTEKVYNIKNKADGTSIFEGADGMMYTKTTDLTDRTQLWVLILGSDEGVYSLRNAGSGNYLTPVQGESKQWNVGGNANDLYIGIQAENYYYISYSEITDVTKASRTAAHNNQWASWGYDNSYVVTWDQNTDASMWSFVETEVSIDEIRNNWSNKVTITYKYTYNDTEISSESFSLSVGNAFPTVKVPYPYALSGSTPSGEVTEEGTYTIECNNLNLPYILTTDDNSPVLYAIKSGRTNEDKEWWYTYDASDAKIALKEFKAEDTQYWYFKAAEQDGLLRVQLYPYAGDGKVMSYNNTNNGAGNVTAQEVGATGYTQQWIHVATDGNAPYGLKTNLGENHLSNNGGYTNKMGMWNASPNSDAGSAMYFYSTEDIAEIYKTVVTTIAAAPENAVGSLIANETNIENARTVETAYEALNEELNLNNIHNLVNAVIALRTGETVPYSDGYYRIMNAQPGLYAKSKGIIYNGSSFVWNSVEKNDANSIVKLITDNGKVVMQTVNSGLYLQGVYGASGANMSQNGHITLTSLGNCYAQYNLKCGNGTLHANNHGGGAGNGDDLTTWGGDFNSASAWYLVPATELEVNLSDVNGEGWATIHLPFDVTLNEGIKAYIGGSTANNELLLTEVNDIPANNGVILYSETPGVHTLNIAAASEEITSNIILGTNVATQIAAGNNYVLANGDNGIGLYIVDEDPATEGYEAFTLAANKAYLSIEGQASSNGFSFRIEGTTGIDEVKGENEKVKAIYDLTGRRIESINAPGIYIINGKKVVIK